MLKEALELLQQTAIASEQTEVLPVEDPRHVRLRIGGEISIIDVPPPLRDHEVSTLADLIAYVDQITQSNPVVWHDDNGVILIPDDSDRRDRVTFPLTHSARLVKLIQLRDQRQSFDQNRFIRLLRIELGLEATMVNKFRKLDWENGDKARGSVQHSDLRLSKEVVAKVQGIEELPEEIPVPVPVYQQPGEREEYFVQCAVEIDAVNRQFQLLPLPDEIERVIACHQADIRSRLDAELSCPIYCGRP